VIQRKYLFLPVAILAAILILTQTYNSWSQPFFFPKPSVIIAPTPHKLVVQQNTTIPQIKTQIGNLTDQLRHNLVLQQTVSSNIFQIQNDIKGLKSQLTVLEQQERARLSEQISKVALPVVNYDKLKHCSPDQTYGNTNYLTYLQHFACGHVTVFNNGTVLRQFTLFVEDFHGSGSPLAISTNKTDPVIFHAWEFNGTVPGPTLRVTQGDHVQITVINRNTSAYIHSMHMHSIHSGNMDGVMGAGGMIFPGSNFTYDFIAQPTGVYPYHCHMAPVEEHISRGLYGMLIIDPPTPRPHMIEMVMMLNSYTFSYEGLNGSGHLNPTVPATAQQIRQNLSQVEENSDENNGPDNQFYSVNGMPFGYTGSHELHLHTGVNYRIYLMNMAEFDPVNSFHIHGTMGNYTSMGTEGSPKTLTDLILLQQGDRGIFEFNYKYPGEFLFHSHINHFTDLGWMGYFNVTKPVVR
jgi:FtsP/CotA-like multicopper oxidase with cupredoxin domain